MHPTDQPLSQLPGHRCQIFRAADISVGAGVNLHDGLAGPDEVCLGDRYELDRFAAPLRLSVRPGAGGGLVVADGSDVGEPGRRVRFTCRYRMTAADGAAVDLLLLGIDGPGGGRHVLPLAPMAPGTGYVLVRIDEQPAAPDLLCVAFAQGTMISMGSGPARPIETLRPGDLVLTRGRGAQPVRWIGHATLRAVGSFAPVVIGRGVLGNLGDLVVSQHHRVFLSHRRPGEPPGPELAVQARHLVDGARVVLREGGFLDVYSLVFDRPEVILAEGIPCESLMVNEATIPRPAAPAPPRPAVRRTGLPLVAC